MTSAAAEHLKDEAERAVELLSDLCKPKPPQKPLGDLNPKAIKHCRVSPFSHRQPVVCSAEYYHTHEASPQCRLTLV